MRNDTTDNLLELEEVAERLKISRWVLNRLIRAGELEVVVLGPRLRRVRPSALETYLAKKTAAPTAPEAA
jgi:excisionase family DNA binding protein